MVLSIVIVAVSFALLIYCIRYSCVVLLSSETERAAYHPLSDTFQFRDVQRRLPIENHLDNLHSSLDRDYEVLTCLRRPGSGLTLSALQERLLVWDYKAMQWCYHLTKTAAPAQAKRALCEMASVIDILVGRVVR